MSDKSEIKSIHISGNGQVLAIDKSGQQIPELQDCNLILTWIEFARSKGYELAGVRIIINNHSYRIMKIDDKYSIEAEV